MPNGHVEVVRVSVLDNFAYYGKEGDVRDFGTRPTYSVRRLGIDISGTSA